MKTASIVVLAAALAAACADQQPVPVHPRLTATVTFAAGGTMPITGADGYWVVRTYLANGSAVAHDTVRLVANAQAAAQGDSAHPVLQSLDLQLAGSSFASFPSAGTLRIGPASTDSVTATALADSLAFVADSGTVTLTPLAAGSVRADFNIFYRRGGGAAFAVAGTLEVPKLVQLMP